MEEKSSCRWRRWGNGFVVQGPATQVKEGAVVLVWNNRRKENTPVRIRAVLSEATSGTSIGFPEKGSVY